MTAKIPIAPYVRGPSLKQQAGIGSPTNWLRRLATFIRQVIRCGREAREEPAAAAAPVVTHWAYRAVNYRHLHGAEIPSAVAVPPIAVGISCHLELEAVAPADLREGDVFLVEDNQTVLADGIILEGIALIDESAVFGQSAAVIRSDDGETTVMRDSRVVAGQILVEVAPRRGHPLDWIEGSTRVESPAPVAAS
jgi:hypothetical protein